MASSPIRCPVFLYNCQPTDVVRIMEWLAFTPFEFVRVATNCDELLKERGVVVTQGTVEGLDSLEATCNQMPVIVLTEGLNGSWTLNAGAWDYLPKETLTRDSLLRSLRYVASQYQLALQMQEHEAELHKSEARFRNLIARNSDGIVVVNEDGAICFVNPAAEQLFGYPASYLLGSPFGFPLSAGNTTEIEILLRTSEIVMAEMRVVETEWDNLPAFLLSLRDITERKRSEQALKQAAQARLEQERLRVALEKEKELSLVKNSFMSTISHEFRTPLAVIQSASDVLDRYYHQLDNEQRRERIVSIKAQIRHLEDMLDEISIVMQAELNHLEFHPVLMDVQKFCQTVLEEVQASIGVNHHFSFTVTEGSYLIPIDPKLLRHILNNLLANAVKYSDTGNEIGFDLFRDGAQVGFRITDHGIGIPEADHARLFEPFYRASNVGAIRGTGLGLKVVKDSVVLHGGTITLASQVGQGTTVLVCLPCDRWIKR